MIKATVTGPDSALCARPTKPARVRVLLRAWQHEGRQRIRIMIVSDRRKRYWRVDRELACAGIGLDYVNQQIIAEAWRRLRAAWRMP